LTRMADESCWLNPDRSARLEGSSLSWHRHQTWTFRLQKW
jgi:hypothetical protein